MEDVPSDMSQAAIRKLHAMLHFVVAIQLLLNCLNRIGVIFELSAL